MRVNIAYACNEAYMEQTTVSLISLFENNKECEEIHIYFIDMGTTASSQKNLIQLADSYNRVLEIVNFRDIAYDLNVNETGRHIQSVYAKLFFGRLEEINKILYLDSDTIITDSIIPLWEENLEKYICAGVETIHTVKDNTAMGLRKEDRAINDGVILMNLEAWRLGNYLQKCLSYIKEYNGKPPVLSEGTINKVCKGRIKILDPRYNLMSGIVKEKQYRIEKLTGRKYYSQSILDKAYNNPCIIHYLSGFYNRPWNKRCTHPLKRYYLQYRAISPYKDKPFKNNDLSIRLRIIGLLYRILPISMFVGIRNIFGEESWHGN